MTVAPQGHRPLGEAARTRTVDRDDDRIRPRRRPGHLDVVGEPGRGGVPHADVAAGTKNEPPSPRTSSSSTSTPARRPPSRECCQVALRLRDRAAATTDRPPGQDERFQGPAALRQRGRQAIGRPDGTNAYAHEPGPGAREGRRRPRRVADGEASAGGQGASSTGARTTRPRRRCRPTRCGPSTVRRCRPRSRGTRSSRGRGRRRPRSSGSPPGTSSTGSTPWATSSHPSSPDQPCLRPDRPGHKRSGASHTQLHPDDAPAPCPRRGRCVGVPGDSKPAHGVEEAAVCRHAAVADPPRRSDRLPAADGSERHEPPIM